MKYNPLCNKVGKYNFLTFNIKGGIKIKEKIIILLIIIIIIFSKESLSKYSKKISIDIDSEITEPIIEIEDDPKVILNSSETKTFYFKVKNFNREDKINEVDLEYYIEFMTNITEEINYKIYKNDEEIKIENNKTEKNLLRSNIKQEDNYRIEISLNDIYLKEIKEEVKIRLYFEQKRIIGCEK